MKMRMIMAGAALGATLAASAGTVVHATMPSEVLGEEKPFTVYLPDGYEEGNGSYPVLYLLHGAWGNDRDWTDKGWMQEIADLAIRSGEAVPMIVVMPDARGVDENFGGEHMGYFNVPGWDYETYFHEELIPYVESNWRVVGGKNHRAIAGLSMGGGGAVAYAQHHPDTWGSACSMSGALGFSWGGSAIDGETEYGKAMRRNDQTAFVAEADPTRIEDLKSVRWYADCGDDDFLWESNVEFFKAMKNKGVPMEYRMRDGAHTWTYWRTALPGVLRYVSAGFRN